MKIGILTFHRAHNYGAVLQCYALQEILKSLGHDACIIDYRQPHIEWFYNPIRYLQSAIKRMVTFKLSDFSNQIEAFHKARNRKKYFESFVCKYLNCTKPCDKNNIPQDIDCYIIGSDQMWGIHCVKEVDPVYWGLFDRPNKSSLYGFSISANGDYRKYLTKEQLCQYFNRFNDISFRESVIRDDFESITGVRKNVTLDPTLLSTMSVWDCIVNNLWKNRKYVTIYQVRKPKNDKNKLEQIALKYAKEKDYEVIDLSSMDYSIEDFISIIKYSKCVFTSSFHATVFSILFHVPFFSFKLEDKHDVRYINLLKQLDLENNLVSLFDNICDLDPRFDGDKVDIRLNEIKKESLIFLKNIR